MFNRKSIYMFLLSATICSMLWHDYIFYLMLTISIVTILFLNRGVFYTFKANKYLRENRVEKGYKLLKKAYKTNTIPYIVINGYIYLSLKLGNIEQAKEAIEKVLIGDVSCKIKETHRRQVLTLKSVYLWKTDNLTEALEILDELYSNGFINTTFYRNYGFMLQLDGQMEKAEKVCLEAYEYGKEDRVTLDNLVAIYIKNSNWEMALKYFNELMDLNPTFPEAFYNGAQIFIHNNDKVKAIEYLDKALNLEFSFVSSITEEEVLKLKRKIEEM